MPKSIKNDELLSFYKKLLKYGSSIKRNEGTRSVIKRPTNSSKQA